MQLEQWNIALLEQWNLSVVRWSYFMGFARELHMLRISLKKNLIVFISYYQLPATNNRGRLLQLHCRQGQSLVIDMLSPVSKAPFGLVADAARVLPKKWRASCWMVPSSPSSPGIGGIELWGPLLLPGGVCCSTASNISSTRSTSRPQDLVVSLISS